MSNLSQTSCLSFKLELFLLIHDFGGGGDQFKLALYNEDAVLNQDTQAYGPTNEVAGAGYIPGGFNLVTTDPITDGNTALASFADLVTGNLTVDRIAGGLIYNASKGNRAVCVLDFGRVLAKQGAPLVVRFPPADRITGLLRIQ